MRTKPPRETPEAGAAPPSTVPGEKTVIQVGPEDVTQRTPRQLFERPLSLVDVILFTVLASTAILGGFMALAFLLDRLRDWLGV